MKLKNKDREDYKLKNFLEFLSDFKAIQEALFVKLNDMEKNLQKNAIEQYKIEILLLAIEARENPRNKLAIDIYIYMQKNRKKIIDEYIQDIIYRRERMENEIFEMMKKFSLVK